MEKTRVHWLQHVPFEGLGVISQWLQKNDMTVTQTKMFQMESLPEIAKFDWLIVMGGAMGVNETSKYPWLLQEFGFVDRAIRAGKTVIGICLGAQIVATVLGAKVTKNQELEVGFFPIEWQEKARQHPFFAMMPQPHTVLHWHGDTFDIPQGALHLASSEACQNQGFLLDDKILGLQFHLELFVPEVHAMISNNPADLQPGRFIQPQEQILANISQLKTNNELLFNMLDQIREKQG